jgi:hypothetical protein
MLKSKSKMKKLTLSRRSVCKLYESICDSKLLSVEEYFYILNLLIYTLLDVRISLQEKQTISFIKRVEDCLIEVDSNVLLKTLYYMDATVDFDSNEKVPLLVNGIYKQHILYVLSSLLLNKRVGCKKLYINISFMEKVYISICTKLKMEKEKLMDQGFLFDYLQRLIKKNKNIPNQFFLPLALKTIKEVSIYSKYDDFDKEICNNYRFLITQSTNNKYPVGSFVFGTIRTGSFVILYKDSKCTLLIQDE